MASDCQGRIDLSDEAHRLIGYTSLKNIERREKKQVNIKAFYDQTITKAIRNHHGDVIGHEPTTHHYTFGSVGSTLSGGFYIKVGDELPKIIKLTTEQQKVSAKVPALQINIAIQDLAQKIFKAYELLRIEGEAEEQSVVKNVKS